MPGAHLCPPTAWQSQQPATSPQGHRPAPVPERPYQSTHAPGRAPTTSISCQCYLFQHSSFASFVHAALSTPCSSNIIAGIYWLCMMCSTECQHCPVTGLAYLSTVSGVVEEILIHYPPASHPGSCRGTRLPCCGSPRMNSAPSGRTALTPQA